MFQSPDGDSISSKGKAPDHGLIKGVKFQSPDGDSISSKRYQIDEGLVLMPFVSVP